jgi:hypothetical protein
MDIDRQTLIEDLLRIHPESVTLLRERGIRCLACGEPIWGTLETAAREKGYSEIQIDQLVIELKEKAGL